MHSFSFKSIGFQYLGQHGKKIPCVSFQSFDSNAFNRLEIMVVDVGIPADWVKVNVQRMVRFHLSP